VETKRLKPVIPDIDTAWLTAQLWTLLHIPSGSRRERALWRVCAALLTEMGLNVREDSARRRFAGQVGNLVATLPGTNRAPAVLLTAHLDTIRADGGEPWLDADGWVRNRRSGAMGADGKAGVAAILGAVRWLARADVPRPTVQVLLTVGEELGMLGARYLDRHLLFARYGLCLDGDTPPHVLFDTGPAAIRWRIRCTAHPSVRSRLERVLRRAMLVDSFETDSPSVNNGCGPGWLRIVRWEPLADGSLVVSGYACSFAPPYVIAGRVCRLARQAAGQAGASVRVSWDVVYPLLDCRNLVEPRVWTSQAVLRVGRSPEFRPATGGCDAHWLTFRGIPTVVAGTGVVNAHSEHERFRLEDVWTAAKVAALFCQAAAGACADAR
jgi:tripeptide aminopeptidase